jgi:hypothetical protein
MTPLRSLLALTILLVAVNAFTPMGHHSACHSSAKTTALSFGFLKELGLEKPSWLPDFGSKKEEKPTEESSSSEEEEEEAESAAVEE